MAGGAGLKLWPRSNEKHPKQFQHLLGDGTMIENTVSRLYPYFAPEEIFVVSPESYSQFVYEQLPSIPKENVITEPFGKNTAPCVSLVLTTIYEKIDDNTVIYALPADHVINNVREFHTSLEAAGLAAFATDGIVTIGVTPTRPETAFGYIQVRENTKEHHSFSSIGVRYTSTFAEKPDKETARRFFESGDFLWNSGIFVSKVNTFWSAIEKYMPEHFQLFKLIKRTVGKEMYSEAVIDAYKQMQSVSLDYAILEKADNVYVVQSTFGWSDLGTWDELYRLSMKDGRNNVILGDVIASGISNSFVMSSDRLIGLAGVDNLIVVDTEEALLILRRGKSEDIIEIIDYMRRKQINYFL